MTNSDKNTDELYERVFNEFSKSNFLTYLDAKIEYVTLGSVAISCEKSSSLLQPQGFIHAGVITTIADVAGGYSALTLAPDNHDILTVELKINLMRPAVGKKITAVGEVIKPGKTLSIVDVSVYDENEKVLAKMTATMFVAPTK